MQWTCSSVDALDLAAWAPHIESDAVLASLMTGIETRSGTQMSQVIHHVAGIGLERITGLSGPNLAQETASG
ncbi:hypothetical protein ACWD4F_27475 [Streptomyces aureus]